MMGILGLHSYRKSKKIHRALHNEVKKWVASARESVEITARLSGYQEAGIISKDNSKLEIVDKIRTIFMLI